MARRLIAYNRSASQRKDIYLTDFKVGIYTSNGHQEKLRWTLNELSRQCATRDGVSYSLQSSLEEGTVVKGDYVTNYNGRLVSVEFFYHLRYEPTKGNIVSLSSTGDQEYFDAINQDFIKYSKVDSKHFNPLKALKRLWIISFINKNVKLANKISTIFNSDTAAFHQAKETVVLTLLLLKKRDVPLDQIIVNVLEVAKSVFNHGGAQSFCLVDSHLDKVWRVYGLGGDKSVDTLIVLLDELRLYLEELTIKEPAALLQEIVTGMQYTH